MKLNVEWAKIVPFLLMSFPLKHYWRRDIYNLSYFFCYFSKEVTWRYVFLVGWQLNNEMRHDSTVGCYGSSSWTSDSLYVTWDGRNANV
jgi:hypothetical protein